MSRQEGDVESSEHDTLLGADSKPKGFQKDLLASMEPPKPTMIEENKYILGIGYMLAMGVCGIVLVALGCVIFMYNEAFVDICNVIQLNTRGIS